MMRAPSAKRLREAFPRLNEKQVRLIRSLCHARHDRNRLLELLERYFPATAEYCRRCHTDPLGSSMWRTTMVLHAIDCILDTHGVEPLYGPGQEPHETEAPRWEYCNAGDPYAATLIYHRHPDALRIGCWADIAERFPSED